MFGRFYCWDQLAQMWAEPGWQKNRWTSWEVIEPDGARSEFSTCWGVPASFPFPWKLLSFTSKNNLDCNLETKVMRDGRRDGGKRENWAGILQPEPCLSERWCGVPAATARA